MFVQSSDEEEHAEDVRLSLEWADRQARSVQARSSAIRRARRECYPVKVGQGQQASGSGTHYDPFVVCIRLFNAALLRVHVY